MKEIALNRNKVGFEIFERFDDIISIVEPFFIGGGSHVSQVLIDEDRIRNTLYTYSRVEFGCVWCDTHLNRIIEYSWDGEVPAVFYDYQSKEGCVVILVNGKWAGGYCPRFNVLNLTDWTHSQQCVQIARELLPRLFQDLKLEKISSDKKKKKRQKVDVTLGTDPEFEEMEEWDRYSPIPTRYSSIDGEIGADGAGYQIELRPRPAKNGALIVAHIRQLMRQIKVPISVKGDRYPLGAHIHIGVPREYRDTECIRAMVQALDEFLGKRLINLSGRARGLYKVLGAYETKPWGFEYRSLPSAFLVSPTIARVVFKIARNVVKTLLEKNKIQFNDPPDLGDYKRIAKLAEKEFELFNKFVEEYRNYNGTAINYNWVRKGVNDFELNINFSDDWNSRCRELVKEELVRHRRFFRKFNVSSIRLYGLRADRGRVVAGFSCSGYERIVHPIGREYEDRYVFGLPYGLRMDGTEEEIKSLVKAIISEIRRRVKKEVA